jgi:Xaa-Pro aminopeptidase
MEYSPGGDNPYVGTVDAGTIERVKGLGVEVVSSGDVAQVMELWSEEQLDQHLSAAEAVMAAKDEALAYIANRRAAGEAVLESQVQRVISDSFDRAGFVYDHAATVGFAGHAGDPHYSPIAGVRDATLADGDVVLLDLWCKVPQPRAPYADITWMAVTSEASAPVQRAFDAVIAARDAAFRAVAEAYEQGRWPAGAEADAAARAVLVDAGFGEVFMHRTGHSLGVKGAHGLAAHLDGFETRDLRRLRPGLGFTIEPGVYLPEFGVRSEINVYVDADGPRATTDLQATLDVIP